MPKDLSGIGNLKFRPSRIFRIRFHAAWVLSLSLVVSFAALVLYILDINYNDTFLFFLLVVLRYSSFIVCLCSIYKLLINIYHVIRRPSPARIRKIILYFIFIVYGVVIILLASLISEIAKGNG